MDHMPYFLAFAIGGPNSYSGKTLLKHMMQSIMVNIQTRFRRKLWQRALPQLSKIFV